MDHAGPISRRGFVLGGLAVLPGAALARAGMRDLVPATIRVASNQGIENASLQQLMADRAFAHDFTLDIATVERRGIAEPMEALLADQAEVCMISAFVGVLPAIEAGRELRLIGAAMQLPALALYVRDPAIHAVRDLAGRSVGIGGDKGLLHILALALLRRHGVDAAAVRFVNCGSNAQVYEAVATGKVDAGLSGIAGMSGTAGTRTVPDGLLWRELPHYTYQPAYASLRALRDRPEAVARCLAAYTRLYRYLSGPASHDAFLDARRHAGGNADGDAEAEAIWRFIRRVRPYALDPGLSPARVAYLQQLNVALGVQSRVLPYAAVVDPAPAIAARRLLG